MRFSIKERYSPKGKAIFRQYWTAYFQTLGLKVTEQSYKTKYNNGESEGHNLEAILPGQSADSIVVVVHYDSMGSRGRETQNPGVDDDMTGMAMMLETSRILVPLQHQMKYTLRFVATD